MGCVGRSASKRDIIMSLAVSVLAQKKGGLSHQPICRLFGTTISISSKGVGCRDGKT